MAASWRWVSLRRRNAWKATLPRARLQRWLGRGCGLGNQPVIRILQRLNHHSLGHNGITIQRVHTKWDNLRGSTGTMGISIYLAIDPYIGISSTKSKHRVMAKGSSIANHIRPSPHPFAFGKHQHRAIARSSARPEIGRARITANMPNHLPINHLPDGISAEIPSHRTPEKHRERKPAIPPRLAGNGIRGKVICHLFGTLVG